MDVFRSLESLCISIATCETHFAHGKTLDHHEYICFTSCLDSPCCLCDVAVRVILGPKPGARSVSSLIGEKEKSGPASGSVDTGVANVQSAVLWSGSAHLVSESPLL